jgi:Rrf2 family iron-sulfur cluster assembly transcriptional regulator
MHGILTDRGRVAVAAMIELAMHSESEPVSLSIVGERQQISLSYLEQLFGRLRRHALVHSMRGRGGGYSLARACEDISVADIIGAVDDPMAAGSRRVAPDRATEVRCHPMTQDLWDGANARLMAYFEAISLKSLVDDRIARGLLNPPVSVRRGISLRPVLKPVHITKINSVFALADA